MGCVASRFRSRPRRRLVAGLALRTRIANKLVREPAAGFKQSVGSADQLGRVDHIVVEFPTGETNFTGAIVDELSTSVDTDRAIAYRQSRL